MYILGIKKQDEVLETLEFFTSSDEGWVRYYRAPNTEQEWIMFYPQPESHGGGIRLLRKDPPPDDINDWIEYCFKSENPDDVNGLGLELSRKQDLWPDVINWLEVNYSNIEKERLVRFIELLGITIPMNRKNTIGIPFSEVEKDYQHLVDLSLRAKDILRHSNPRSTRPLLKAWRKWIQNILGG